MARAQENEAEAVRTTIVGGRPPGSGRNNVPVPRGIEVLVKKAAVDAEFRALLLAQRGRAATSIELELDPAESAMLNSIPQEQLARIVDQTEVATALRPAFAGRVGAVMLAALGAGLVTSSVAKAADVPSDRPQGVASTAKFSTAPNAAILAQGFVVFGLMTQLPTNLPPTNPPATNPPGTNSPATNVVPPVNIFGLQPFVAVAGAMAPVPPPTNPPATNRPSTNSPATNPAPLMVRGMTTHQSAGPIFAISAGLTAPVPPTTNPPVTNLPASNAVPSEQNRPMLIRGLMIQVPPPKPPETNPADINPPVKKPDEQK